MDLKEPLEWAKDNINSEGGIDGRTVELVYKDSNTGNVTQKAQELLDDPTIRIIIGPDTSDQVYELAPEFFEKKKLLISPLSTSGDIIRAFGKTGYFWRTCPGDVAQVKVILSILNNKGANRVALLAENTMYGKTFYDWTGFFAIEYGLELTSIQQFDKGSVTLDAEVAEALQTNPDYIVAACGAWDAATIKRAIDRSGSTTKLFLTDAGGTPILTSSLGAAAEGIEGTNPTADPTTGFSVAYQKTLGHPPAYFAAPTYDAFLLAAYTTARQEASPFESLADSFRTVVYGTGTPHGWDAQESHEAITAFSSGNTPSISGASGPLDFDTVFGVDPLFTYYSHWIVEEGEFRTVRILNLAKSRIVGESVGLSKASESFISALSPKTESYTPVVQKEDFQAVIVGPSSGWDNYRHQSDALAVYTMLRMNGIDDDHIILMLYDDVATTPQNPLPGDVHNIPMGDNLRSGAVADYTGKAVNAETLNAVLLGDRSASVPVVLESNGTTDVFVYIVSHGSPNAICFGQTCPFTTDDFTTLTDTMNRDGKYRQLVFFVDTCFGESVATNVTAPGILYLTGAAKNEPSLGAVYDLNIRQWLSDEFTASVLTLVRLNPDITFRELYIRAYEKVTGSHVRIKTTGNFSIDQPVMEYLQP